MSHEPPPEPRPHPLTAGRQIFDDAYLRADALLDLGQHRVFRLLWFFLPETSIARDLRFQQVVASRFFSDAGQQAVAYGALIAVVRGGGSAFEAALVGVAAVLPPALFGLYGGAIADTLPSRFALAIVYNLQALLCVLTPVLFGTDLAAVLLLLFAINALGQVSGPTESSVIPLVASTGQLASAASLVSLASNVGTAFGTALLAPILVRAFGTDAVFYVAAGLLFVAASRVFDLPTHHDDRAVAWRRPPKVNIRSTLLWIIRERAVGTMIMVAVVAGTANIVLQTLAPRYVQAVVRVDPADAVYVFAPSAVGLVVALLAGPWLVRRRGERSVAIVGFAVTSAALVLLGLVSDIRPIVDPINPMRILELFRIDIGPSLRTAGFLAVFVGFGSALTTTSVQTYINRRVPIAYQGRAFALQSTLKNGTSIVPLLTLGAAASFFGVESVLIVAPFALLSIAVVLVRASYLLGDEPPPPRFDVLSSFWEESDEPIGSPDDAPSPAPVAEGELPEGA